MRLPGKGDLWVMERNSLGRHLMVTGGSVGGPSVRLHFSLEIPMKLAAIAIAFTLLIASTLAQGQTTLGVSEIRAGMKG